jgi:hypothetical protein
MEDVSSRPSVKDFQVLREASFFVSHFCLPVSESGFRIQIKSGSVLETLVHVQRMTKMDTVKQKFFYGTYYTV